jgi:hypothetical protein
MAKGKAPDHFQVRESFSANFKGVPVTYRQGEPVHADDPVARQWPDYFEPLRFAHAPILTTTTKEPDMTSEQDKIDELLNPKESDVPENAQTRTERAGIQGTDPGPEPGTEPIPGVHSVGTPAAVAAARLDTEAEADKDNAAIKEDEDESRTDLRNVSTLDTKKANKSGTKKG